MLAVERRYYVVDYKSNRLGLHREAYDEAGLQAEYHRFEGAGHMFEGEDARRSSELAKAWFDRWLLIEDPVEDGRSGDSDRDEDS